MAKKNNGGFLFAIASFTGQLAGSVKGAVELTSENAREVQRPKQKPVHSDVGFEKSDINDRGVILGGICLLGGLWLTVGLLFFYFASLQKYRAEVSPPALPFARSGVTLPPEPRLQDSPEKDLRSFRITEDWKLTHYYWLDKTKGRVAIPIEQAMQMLAERGIPPAKTPPNPTLTPPQDGTRLTGFEGVVKPEPR
jgi:hypothetical protein